LPDRRRPGRPDRRQDRSGLRADGRRMVTLKDAARHLETNVDTIRKLIASGTLKAVQLSPRCTRIPERHLVEYLDTYEGPVRPRKTP
jgi:excisionase family DNA binding protein